MKNIAIITNKMVMGGIEKSLISVLKEFKSKKINIDLYIKDDGGELKSEIPDFVNVKIITNKDISIKNYIKKSLKQFNIISAIKLSYNLMRSYFAKSSYDSYESLSNSLPRIEKKYDVAICYSYHYSFSTIYTINNINANKKIMWIHNESWCFKELINSYKKYYDRYNHIIGVSKCSIDDFLHMFPCYKNKVSLLYNRIYDKEIYDKSMELKNVFSNNNEFSILTIGRIANQKGYDIAINVAKKLRDEGINFKWYWIGEGEEEDIFIDLLTTNKIYNEFILLGNKSNPYPFIRECDIYVQPSRHEGYCLTLAEARALYKPIVTTNFAGAKEQIKNNKTGLIVDCNDKQIYDAIIKLLNSEDLRNEFHDNLKKERVDTRDEIKKLYEIIK